MVPTRPTLEEVIFVPEELFAFLRKAEFVRDLLEDLPDAEVQALFARANLKPGGSKSKVRQFVKAKLPEFLKFMRHPEPMRELLATWHCAHWPAQPEGVDPEDPGPLTIRTTEGLDGWRALLFSLLTAGTDLPDALRQSIVGAIGERVDGVPDDVAKDWDGWARATALSRRSAGLRELVESPELHEDLDAGLQKLTGVGGPPESVAERLEWIARVEKLSRDVCVGSHVTLRRLAQLSVEILDVIDEMPGLSDQAQRLAPLRAKLSGGDDGDDVSMLAGAVSALVDELPAIEKRAHEIAASFSTDPLVGVIDDAISFVRSLGAGLSEFPLASLRSAADKIERVGKEDGSRRAEIADHPALSALVVLLDPGADDTAMTKAWSDLEYELGRRFCEELRPHLDARRASAAGETEGPNGREFEAAGSGAPEAGDGPEAGAEGPARTSTGSSDGVPAEALSAGEPASVAPPQSSPGSETGGGEDGADASSDPATARVDAHGGGGEAPRDASTPPAPAEQAAPDNRDRGDPVSAVRSSGDASGERPSAVEPKRAEADTISVRLQDNLRRFSDFKDCHWIDPDGICRRAPWLEEEFVDRLMDASRPALEQHAFEHLYVFSRALEVLDVEPFVHARDVESLADIWTNPSSSIAGVDRERAPGLRAGSRARGRGRGPEAALLGVFLECVRPHPEEPLSWPDAQAILASVEVSHADLRAVLECLLPLAGQGLNPVSEMRRALQATLAKSSRKDLLASLADARKRFQEVVKTRWSAAGGRIERTHCRKAWGGFVSGFVQPLANVFYLSSTGGDADHDGWDLEDLKGRVRRLLAEHDEVARKAGARFSDRARMISAAREIADAATVVVEVATQLRAHGAPPGRHHVPFPADEVRRLLEGDPLESLSEECCRQVLIRLKEGATGEVASAKPALSIGLDLVVQHPDFLRVLIRTDGVEALCKGQSVPLDVIDNWADAAARLMADPAEPAGEGVGRAEALRLLATRLRAADRGDLLTCLLGAGVFDMQEKRHIHAEQSEKIDLLLSKVIEIEQIHARLDEMAVADAPLVRAAAREAEQLLGSDEQSGHEELPLLSAWVDAIRSSSEDLSKNALETVRVQAEALSESERREAALGALARSRPGEALAILDPTAESGSADGRTSERRTEWRDDAEKIYSAPVAALREADVDAREFAELWAKRPRDHNDLQRLERLFWYFISGEQKAGASGRRRRGVPKELRELRSKDVLIHPVELRAFLKREGLNPTFLPQLRDFQSIVISAPRGAAAASLPRDVARAVSSHGKNGENCLVAMLIPGLSANQRAEILLELRRRKLPGAVIDDVDICRLVHPGGERPDGFLGFLEIALEQLHLSLVTPFRGHDGQHIKEETFVGRRDSVADLVGSERYTRVFSGRKLGKSALLKFVELTHDESKLPSGNTLRVLDIIVAGGESEAWLTAEIKEQMKRRLGFKADYTGSGDPGDELTDCMAQFARERPETSLLIILDEADVFVEGQLREYDTKREKCLSFRMMKTIPGNDRDRNDFPRVRFVFSGYRVTSTNEGTWANAGGVLKLPPLADEPARQLIEGPFARIGVDIREHAAYIARRCGFQPAVIIRFGERLLERLVQTRGASGREGLRVKRDDVVETFSDSSVEDEIRTVVTNNFQGNRVASIIFHSLLLAFKELPPGAVLVDAPGRILEQLTSVDSDTSWLREIDPTEVGEIQRALTDLEDRQLLVRGSAGREVRYRLKFPHHLAVLLQTDPANVIRQQIQALRAGREDTHLPNLLSQQTVEELREIYSGELRSDDLAVAVVGSPWIDAIQSERGGVADKLGLRMEQCLDFRASPSRDTTASDGPLVGLNARPDDAEEILSRRGDGGRPPILLGGPELLRWAIERDQASSERFYETFGLRRLSARRLGWWFERLRNYQFASAGAVGQIHRLTGGIPFLVALFDQQLSRAPGEDVSEPGFREAVEAYRDGLSDWVEKLRPGPLSGSLNERELHWLAVISDLGRNLGDGEMPTPTHELDNFGAVPADYTAIRFLDLAGFIVLQDGKVVITDDQPLQELLEVLQA